MFQRTKLKSIKSKRCFSNYFAVKLIKWNFKNLWNSWRFMHSLPYLYIVCLHKIVLHIKLFYNRWYLSRSLKECYKLFQIIRAYTKKRFNYSKLHDNGLATLCNHMWISSTQFILLRFCLIPQMQIVAMRMAIKKETLLLKNFRDENFQECFSW